MKMAAESYPIWQVELWHGVLLLALLGLLAPLGTIDPFSFLVGGVFMGGNFLLLGLGIRSVLAPFAGKGKIRTGVVLLTLKLFLFLGLLSGFFLKFQFDAISFALGVSCLLVAALAHGLRYRYDTMEATR